MGTLEFELHDILIHEMKNGEGKGGKYLEKEKSKKMHILHNLHDQTPFVISFQMTYHIIGLWVVFHTPSYKGVSCSPLVCLCLCICLCLSMSVRIWIADIMGFQKNIV